MIKFLLACERGHEFESWFPDSDAFETQARRGLVACPECDSRTVHKALMAPAVLAARHVEEARRAGADRRKAARAACGDG